MIRRVTFYWILLTLLLVDSWLLSKPNLLGKIGLLVYKYHYLRSFPRTLLTVWIVVSIAVLTVLLVQYLRKHEKISKILATVVLSLCFVAAASMMIKVYIDFTSWSYSHSGIKFRYGAYLLPMILMLVFANGIFQILTSSETRVIISPEKSENIPNIEKTDVVSHDTSQP